MAERLHGLYFNGLGNQYLPKSEERAIASLHNKGIYLRHFSIDWQRDEDIDELVERTMEATQALQREYGKVLLVGASAGGSLAINTFAALQKPVKNVLAITLCSRIYEAALPWYEIRTLRRMAHIGTVSESRLFENSVRMSTVAISSLLGSEEKKRIIAIKQWADEVVPKLTVTAEGVPTYTVPTIGHHSGILTGLRYLPTIVS